MSIQTVGEVESGNSIVVLKMTREVIVKTARCMEDGREEVSFASQTTSLGMSIALGLVLKVFSSRKMGIRHPQITSIDGRSYSIVEL